ncbi:MAG: hypothetical protein AB1427_00900 [Thermodesulfobacteriota bacterium]
MKIKYDQGPDKISMGAAGEFRRGEPRDVPDETAERLLNKQSIKFIRLKTDRLKAEG